MRIRTNKEIEAIESDYDRWTLGLIADKRRYEWIKDVLKEKEFLFNMPETDLDDYIDEIMKRKIDKLDKLDKL